MREMSLKDLVKYFVHGIVFSILFTILAIAWIFGFLVLLLLGSFIGLIIGFVLLMLIVGFVNAVITAQLWFPIKYEFWSLLGHGFVLFIVLSIVNAIFILAPSLAFPGIATSVVTFIIGSFLDGLVGKWVAGWFKQDFPEGISAATEAEWMDRNL